MRRPLLRVALCYVGGVLLGNRLPLPLVILFPAAIAVLIAAFARPALRPGLLAALLVLAGWTHFTARNAVLSPHDLRRLVGEGIELATLEGRLLETPDLRRVEKAEEEQWRSLAVLEVSALRVSSDWRRAQGRVAVTTLDAPTNSLFAGQRCRVTGVLQRPPGAAADGLFDYQEYLARKRVYYQLRAQGEKDWEAVGDASGQRGPAPADRFADWARATLARGLPAEDKPLQLLWAMSLGWRTALTGQVSEPFMRSGTMHIFAISGLHVALIASILVALVRVARVPRRACGLIVIPLLWFYTAATGWQSSAIRATIMMSVIVAGWALQRPGDLLNSLGGAAFLILLWQPEQLFQASFQLSFAVVASIALLLPPIERWQQRLLAPDPLLPPELRPRWQRWLDTPVRWISTSFAMSTAATLGSLPLIAHYFHLVTPVGLLANPPIVACSGLALACCLGSLLCGDWLPWIGQLFNHAGWFWMWAMIGLSEWSASLPAAFVYVRTPSPVMTGGYYLLLLAVFAGKRVARGRLAAAVAGALLLTGSAGHRWLDRRATVKITVLPARGGDAIVVDAPGGTNDTLIDAGNEATAATVVVPFLRSEGLRRFPRLVLTHGDVRHVGGVKEILRAFPSPEVLVSSFRFRSPIYRQVLGGLADAGVRIRPLDRGSRVGGWTVLHPQPEDRFTQSDDAALVLRGDFDGVRVLLLSDLGRPGQRALIEREPDLRADIVVTGIPAQSEPLGDDFLGLIQPRAIVVSAGEFPATERPAPPLRERLAKSAVPVIYTSDEGAVSLIIRPKGWEIRSMRGTVLRGGPRPASD